VSTRELISSASNAPQDLLQWAPQDNVLKLSGLPNPHEGGGLRMGPTERL
jgi:hypothetical protein